MQVLRYDWDDGATRHEMQLVPVQGTRGAPYLFGAQAPRVPVEVPDFHLMHTTVTQALWKRVMDANFEAREEPRRPVDNVSWDDITRPGGFLERINASEILPTVNGGDPRLTFRLPSETEWEYAARGGPHWRDGFAFSGSDDIDAVAWYGRRWSGGRLKWELLKQLKAWRLFDQHRLGQPRRSQPVGMKAPNQLGIYDMSGNVWEWCQDTCVELDAVPRDGTPASGGGTERRLRGGCHHNWDIHCTVSWRYSYEQNAHGGSIGFRLALASAPD
jgi:formylglycine-generating enzyme required for sulfatase activity